MYSLTFSCTKVVTMGDLDGCRPRVILKCYDWDGPVFLFPTYAGDWTGFDCLLDQVFRPSFWFDDYCFSFSLIKFEDLRADLLAGATTHAVSFIDNHHFIQ